MTYWIPIAGFGTLLVALVLRRPAVALLLVFVLVSFVVHMMGTLYVDLAGPVFSIQLVREIGPARSAGVLALAYLVTIAIPIMSIEWARRGDWMVRAIADQPRSTLTEEILGKWFLALSAVGLLVMVVDLVRSGTIPLLSGMERWTYTQQYAGSVHKWYVEFGNFYAGMLGYFWAVPLLSHRPLDRRFFLLAGGFMAYWLLVGNRFSIFYSWGSFFVMPLAIILLARRVVPTAVGAIGNAGRVVMVTGAVIAAVSITTGIYQSLVVTRGFGQEFASAALKQRTLIETGEMWVVAHDRLFVEGGGNPAEARDMLFRHPLVSPERNTSIPYLMWLEVGDYAIAILDAGSNYGGGFPDIAFYLAGVTGGWWLLAGMAALQSIVLLVLCRAVLARQAVLVFLAIYVLYPLMLFNISAMLNFLVAWTFWVKVAALVGWIGVEHFRVLADGDRLEKRFAGSG